MKYGLLLIVGDRVDGDLLEAVSGAGYTAVFIQSMCEALHRVRDERVAAVVVDGRPKCEDLLEFVLNVRDLRDGIPLLVIEPCGRSAAAKVVRGQARTRLVAGDISVQELVAEIRSMIHAGDGSVESPGAAHSEQEQVNPERRDP